MTEQAKPFKRRYNRIETLKPAENQPATGPAVRQRLSERERNGGNPTEPRYERSVLDTLLASGKINWEILLWIGIIALAILTRYFDLAPRAMHHDESIHGKFSYDMFKGISIYKYDPTWHGPFLYYMVSLSYFLLGGATEFSARFSPALFSVLMVAICWCLRPIIGRVGAVAFALFVLVSPSILYYGRSLRHDMFATFGMLLFVIGWFRYAQEKPGKRIWWMALAGLGFFVLFSSHEMSFLNLGIVLSWLGFVFLYEIIALPAKIRVKERAVPVSEAARLESKPVYKDDDVYDPELDESASSYEQRATSSESENTERPQLHTINLTKDSDAIIPPATVSEDDEANNPQSSILEKSHQSDVRRDPIFGNFRIMWTAFYALFAFLVLSGSVHLFTDKFYDGDIQRLFGWPAWVTIIPLYLLLSAPIAYVLARFVTFGYNRLSASSNFIARIAALAVFVGLGAVATFLFLRGKSPTEYMAAVGQQVAGNPSAATTQTVTQGYEPFSQFAYVALEWYSIIPQLAAIAIVALVAGMLVGWLVERGLLLYSRRGLIAAGICFGFVWTLAGLISLRFILVGPAATSPKLTVPVLGTVDKWLAYVIGGFVLALIIGVVAGWFVSLSERLGWDDMRGSTVFRAILKFAGEPRAVIALLLGFGILYVLMFSNFFFAPERLADGFYRGIEYWGEQHGKRRLDQPWFYYPMLMLLYETAAVFFLFIAAVYFPVTFWRRTVARGRFVFTPKGVFIGMTFYWTVAALIIYSIAGEKIPWLNMQVAMPASLAAAAFLDDYLRRLPWRRIFAPREGLLFGGLFLLMFAATLGLIGMAVNFPKENQFNLGITRIATGSDIALATIQMVLVSLIIIGMFGFALWLWWSNRLEGRIARAVIVLLIGATLFTYGVKSTIALNYDHPDVAIEPMIYTQTTPEVPLFTERLGRLSRDLRDIYKVTPAAVPSDQLPPIYPDPANSKGLPLYVSSEVAWPLSWYLREYNNVTWGAVNGDQNANPIDRLTDNRGNNYVMIMISAGENTSKMQQMLQGQYTAQQYRFRWHFPEDDSGYGGLGYAPSWDSREYRIAAKDIINTRWDMFVRSFTEQPFAGRLWRYVAYRELWQPLQSFDMVIYVRNDVYSDWAMTQNTNAQITTNPDSQPAFDLTASTQAGNRNGQFRTPRNVTIAPNGDILVLDSLNGRVQRFDATGKWLSKFGSIGGGDGQFTLAAYESGPGGITTDEDGNIYVTDTWGYRILKFDKDGKFLLKWGSGGQDTKGDPTINTQYPTHFYGPRAIAYEKSAGELYITDTGNKRVVVYDKQGNFKRQFGSVGTAPGQFNEPVGIAVGPDGNLYISDLRNRRIQVVDKTGNAVREIPVPSWKEAQLSEPYIAVNAQNEIFVSDPANAALLKFDKDGKQLTSYSAETGVPLSNPIGLALDTQGNLVVADAKRHSVSRFKP
jgi:uncharacterized protein (TIGR03663 family)